MAALSTSDADWITSAQRLGARGMGRTWPNPAVGCIITDRNGLVAGRGWTQAGGRPHAEVVALSQAGDAAHGGTAYVSLEPCAHHGVTPPCAEALIAAGLARVVIGAHDPDPRVNGSGAGMLRAAGIEVVGLNLSPDPALEGFLSKVNRARPFVTVKLATTLDGCIATQTGQSKWITGPLARRYVHGLRSQHDAIMVGRGTIDADDPMLDVRGMGDVPSPVRVVLDTHGRINLTARVLATATQVPTWVVHGPEVAPARRQGIATSGGELLEVALDEAGHVDLNAALSALSDRGITRVFCEGGSIVAASLFQADLVDELIHISAGKLFGEDGRSAIGSLGVGEIAQAPHMRLHARRTLGKDICSIWRRD